MSARAVIYARYSSDNQREASIEDQVRLCKERLACEGWELVQVYQDRAISGASARRPAYKALLQGAREGGFDMWWSLRRWTGCRATRRTSRRCSSVCASPASDW